MSSSVPGPTFALIGVTGYIARRHLEAIRDVGGTLRAEWRGNRSKGEAAVATCELLGPAVALCFPTSVVFCSYFEAGREAGWRH